MLWDRKHDTIVNNESREIIRMFDTFYEAGLGNGTTLSPVSLRKEIDAMIDANYESVNNGVYKSGFARTQSAYDEAVTTLFHRLDQLEEHLTNRDWLVGEGIGNSQRQTFAFSLLWRDLISSMWFISNVIFEGLLIIPIFKHSWRE